MKKKIIFFDGDGTLWYPKTTKHNKHPVWIWKEHDNDIKKVRKGLILIPTVLETLKKLKKKGIMLILLSTSPFPPEEANARVQGNVKHFNLSEYFEEVHGTREYLESKGEYILKILKKYNFSKKQALMVGDSYSWDYKPAKERGIDALLIESEYELMNKRVKKTIKKLSDIFLHIS